MSEPAMRGRLRLVSVTVQPNVLLDSLDELTPVPVNALTIPAARLDDLPTLLRDALAELQTQLGTEGHANG